MATTLEQVLHGRDTISSKDAKVTVTINGDVINLIDCKELKINIKKNKEKVQVLGDHWTKHKTTSIDGTGTLGQYVINSNWLKYGIPYTMKEGDLYFTITFTIQLQELVNKLFNLMKLTWMKSQLLTLRLMILLWILRQISLLKVFT